MPISITKPIPGGSNGTWGTIYNAALDALAAGAVGLDELVINVQYHGAVGDGVTDDTTAINAVLAAAPVGSRVILGPGKTYLTSGIVLNGLTGVTFDGNGAEILLASTGARHGIQLNGACTQVHVRNHSIVGNGVLADAHAGVWVSDLSGVALVDCSATNNHVYNTTVGITVNLTSGGGTVNGWLCAHNYIDTMIGTTSGNGYGLHISAGQTTPTGARIVNNTVTKAQRHSIYHAMGVGSVIAGNTILNHRLSVNTGAVFAAITCLRSQRISITGNSVSDGYDGAINVASDTGATDSVVVSGNVFANPQDTVPLVNIGDTATNTAARNIAVVGNVLGTTSTGRLVKVNAGINVLIAHNEMDLNNASGGSAVELAGCNDTGGTATYNNNISVRDNLIVLEGGGTAYAVRLTGAETSTAILKFRSNDITGATHAFIGTSNVSNPNITVEGQARDGLVFTTPAVAATIVNGVTLGGLSTGLVKNTTTTGVPSIAVAADVPVVGAGTAGPLDATKGSPGLIPSYLAFLVTLNATAWPAANEAVFQRFTVPFAAAYRYMNFRVDVASGNIQYGIVLLSGTGNTAYTRILNSGVITCPTAGDQHADLGSTTLSAGEYAFFLWFDNTTVTTRYGTNSGVTSTRTSAVATSLTSGVSGSGTLTWSGSAILGGLTLERDI